MSKKNKKQQIDLSTLDPETLKQLMSAARQKMNEENSAKREARADYKREASTAVEAIFPKLQQVSRTLAEVKQLAYDKLMTLVNQKAELYNREQDQPTHTFSSADGSVTITIGYNLIDGWDDTCETGIRKVRDFLHDLGNGKDEETQKLIKTINRLLRADASGNLKASRVLELQRVAEDFNNPVLTDAIEIIRDSYKPKRSKRFVQCRFRDEQGAEHSLPLNITDVELPEPEASPENRRA